MRPIEALPSCLGNGGELPLPLWANLGTDVAVRVKECCAAIRFLGCDSVCIGRFPHDSVSTVAIRKEGSTVEMGIGYFGDARLAKNGAIVTQRVSERQTVCIRKLADDRNEQVKFRRFLSNEAVTVGEMVAHRGVLVAVAAAGRHVLALQDTSRINY